MVLLFDGSWLLIMVGGFVIFAVLCFVPFFGVFGGFGLLLCFGFGICLTMVLVVWLNCDV